ncbi:hypothetical protein ACKKBG_A06620 [Auxenochlorella protothecoides x Auxenochlorella symbiontica]
MAAELLGRHNAVIESTLAGSVELEVALHELVAVQVSSRCLSSRTMTTRLQLECNVCRICGHFIITSSLLRHIAREHGSVSFHSSIQPALQEGVASAMQDMSASAGFQSICSLNQAILHYYLSDYSSAEAALQAAQNLPTPAHRVQRDFLATEVALARRLAVSARARLHTERAWLGVASEGPGVGRGGAASAECSTQPEPGLDLHAVHALHEVRASLRERDTAAPGVLESLLADIAALDPGEGEAAEVLTCQASALAGRATQALEPAGPSSESPAIRVALGCGALTCGRPNTAALHFTEALRGCSAAPVPTDAPGGSQPSLPETATRQAACPDALSGAGLAHLQAGRHGLAARCFAGAAQRAQRAPWPWIRLAECAMREEVFRRPLLDALALPPRRPWAWPEEGSELSPGEQRKLLEGWDIGPPDLSANAAAAYLGHARFLIRRRKEEQAGEGVPGALDAQRALDHIDACAEWWAVRMQALGQM